MKYKKMLSSSVIRAIEVKENFEPMCSLADIPNLFFDDTCLDENKFVRQEVAQMIINAQSKLPSGIFLKVVFGFRSHEKQMEFWNAVFTKTQKENPNVSLSEQERLTRIKVADPRDGKYGTHQTGGAVDVTLCDVNGVQLDMGTSMIVSKEPSNKIKTYPVEYKKLFGIPYYKKLLISKEALVNRKILYDAMTSVGFINYPGEWWHYSYGDRAWAAYKDMKQCFYGNASSGIKFIK